MDRRLRVLYQSCSLCSAGIARRHHRSTMRHIGDIITDTSPASRIVLYLPCIDDRLPSRTQCLVGHHSTTTWALCHPIHHRTPTCMSLYLGCCPDDHASIMTISRRCRGHVGYSTRSVDRRKAGSLSLHLPLLIKSTSPLPTSLQHA